MYDRAWYESLEPMRAQNERALLCVFAYLGRPESYLDIGCGDGWMVYTARRLGCRPTIGIEETIDARKVGHRWATILVRNLSRPFILYDFHSEPNTPLRFDLVTALYSQQRIYDDSLEVYIDNVAKHCRQWLIFADDRRFSWHYQLELRGIVYDAEQTSVIANAWKKLGFELAQSVQVFRRVEWHAERVGKADQ